MATRAQLLGYRKDLADLRTTREVLTRLGLDAAEVEREIGKLADWVVAVDVRCVSCGDIVQVPAKVDEPRGDLPSACICEPCDRNSLRL